MIRRAASVTGLLGGRVILRNYVYNCAHYTVHVYAYAGHAACVFFASRNYTAVAGALSV